MSYRRQLRKMNLMKKFENKLVFILISISVYLCCGCSTLRWFDRKQDFLVESEPTGAQVFIDDRYLGTTPIHVKLERSRKEKSLKLESENYYEELIPLQSSFRWGYSGLGNLLFGGFFIPAIAIDISTGAGWDYDETGRIFLREKNHSFAESPPESLSISPPQNTYEALSDEVGMLLSRFLRGKLNQTQVYDYDNTKNIFYGYHYTFKEKNAKKDSLDLYADLRSSHLAHSVVIQKENTADIKIKIENTKTGKIDHELEWSLPANRLKTWNRAVANVWSLFSAVPNNFGVELASSVSEIKLKNGQKITGANGSPEGFIGGVNRVIEGISISAVDGVKIKSGSMIRFSFVPTIYIFNNSYEYTPENVSGFEKLEVSRLRLGVGYGPLLSWNNSWANLFIKLIPSLDWTKMTWKTSQFGEKDGSQTSMTAELELGLLKFINENWNIKLSVRNVSENNTLFRQAIDDAYVQKDQYDSAGRVSVGMTISRFFPSMKRQIGKWLR